MKKARKKIPNQGAQHSLMDRTRATVGLLNSHRGASKEMEMYAFMSLFHPELSHEKKRKICRAE